MSHVRADPVRYRAEPAELLHECTVHTPRPRKLSPKRPEKGKDTVEEYATGTFIVASDGARELRTTWIRLIAGR
ncbi:MAG: hypothetical protein U0263_16930 [Polyangiaceae bacterium]